MIHWKLPALWKTETIIGVWSCTHRINIHWRARSVANSGNGKRRAGNSGASTASKARIWAEWLWYVPLLQSFPVLQRRRSGQDNSTEADNDAQEVVVWEASPEKRMPTGRGLPPRPVAAAGMPLAGRCVDDALFLLRWRLRRLLML